MTTLANQCPQGNTQDEFDDASEIVIHGPTWTRRMVYDDHARTVIVPELKGWTFRMHPLGWIEAFTPWRPEVLQ